MSAGGFEQVPGTNAGSYNLMDPEGYTRQAAGNLFGDLSQNMMNKGLGAMDAWTTQGPGGPATAEYSARNVSSRADSWWIGSVTFFRNGRGGW